MNHTRTTRFKAAAPLALGGLAANWLDKGYRADLGIVAMIAAQVLAFPGATTVYLLGLEGLVTASRSPVPKIVSDIREIKNIRPEPKTEDQVLQGWE